MENTVLDINTLGLPSQDSAGYGCYLSEKGLQALPQPEGPPLKEGLGRYYLSIVIANMNLHLFENAVIDQEGNCVKINYGANIFSETPPRFFFSDVTAVSYMNLTNEKIVLGNDSSSNSTYIVKDNIIAILNNNIFIFSVEANGETVINAIKDPVIKSWTDNNGIQPFKIWYCAFVTPFKQICQKTFPINLRWLRHPVVAATLANTSSSIDDILRNTMCIVNDLLVVADSNGKILFAASQKNYPVWFDNPNIPDDNLPEIEYISVPEFDITALGIGTGQEESYQFKKKSSLTIGEAWWWENIRQLNNNNTILTYLENSIKISGGTAFNIERSEVFYTPPPLLDDLIETIKSNFFNITWTGIDLYEQAYEQAVNNYVNTLVINNQYRKYILNSLGGLEDIFEEWYSQYGIATSQYYNVSSITFKNKLLGTVNTGNRDVEIIIKKTDHTNWRHALTFFLGKALNYELYNKEVYVYFLEKNEAAQNQLMVWKQSESPSIKPAKELSQRWAIYKGLDFPSAGDRYWSDSQNNIITEIYIGASQYRAYLEEPIKTVLKGVAIYTLRNETEPYTHNYQIGSSTWTKVFSGWGTGSNYDMDNFNRSKVQVLRGLINLYMETRYGSNRQQTWQVLFAIGSDYRKIGPKGVPLHFIEGNIAFGIEQGKKVEQSWLNKYPFAAMNRLFGIVSSLKTKASFNFNDFNEGAFTITDYKRQQAGPGVFNFRPIKINDLISSIEKGMTSWNLLMKLYATLGKDYQKYGGNPVALTKLFGMALGNGSSELGSSTVMEIMSPQPTNTIFFSGIGKLEFEATAYILPMNMADLVRGIFGSQRDVYIIKSKSIEHWQIADTLNSPVNWVSLETQYDQLIAWGALSGRFNILVKKNSDYYFNGKSYVRRDLFSDAVNILPECVIKGIAHDAFENMIPIDESGTRRVILVNRESGCAFIADNSSFIFGLNQQEGFNYFTSLDGGDIFLCNLEPNTPYFAEFTYRNPKNSLINSMSVSTDQYDKEAHQAARDFYLWKNRGIEDIETGKAPTSWHRKTSQNLVKFYKLGRGEMPKFILKMQGYLKSVSIADASMKQAGQ
jgi:hypothetical protein